VRPAGVPVGCEGEVPGPVVECGVRLRELDEEMSCREAAEGSERRMSKEYALGFGCEFGCGCGLERGVGAEVELFRRGWGAGANWSGWTWEREVDWEEMGGKDGPERLNWSRVEFMSMK
jgi:hypothetical protein